MINPCPGCKATFPKQDGPMWRYGVTSPECWAAYSQLLAWERENMGFPPENRLVVDAYAVQHPQNFELQRKLGISQRMIDASVQSVAGHLLALYMALEKKMPLKMVTRKINELLSKDPAFRPLNPPVSLGQTTIKDFSTDFSYDEYKEFAGKWAHAAWQAWEPYHALVRDWYTTYLENEHE